ncbi:MAG TPA: FixH family protein [Enhygromyxa sp.]|nr:FixH family protein [Enhygromyxa sp.]
MSTLLRLALALPFALALACDSKDGEDDHSHEHETDTGHETGHETDTGHEESDCAAETRDDEFSIGLSKSGEILTVSFVAADPAPPIKGDNTWTLAIADVEGQPLSNLTITAVPWMPDHDHGTPVEATATATENPGEFVVTPVNLFMSGLWEVTLDIELQDGPSDQVVFAFCVE